MTRPSRADGGRRHQRLELHATADAIEAFCHPVRTMLTAAATFGHRRQLAEPLIGAIMATDGTAKAEIGYAPSRQAAAPFSLIA